MPTLNTAELGAFEDAYRGRVLSRDRIWTGNREFFVRSYPDTVPEGGTSLGDDDRSRPGGRTSTGDDSGSGPRTGGGTSSGDEYWTGPQPGGGTSSGDDRGHGYGSPAPGGGTSSGDSTGNGYPGEDDF